VLHDISKLGISDAILLKRGPLTAGERKVMEQHTVIGNKLCMTLKSLHAAAPIVRHHHERWNRTGYPDRLASQDIPLLARVFQIVDIYDALASSRPYKSAFATETIIRGLREETSKGWLDSFLVKRFMEFIENHDISALTPSDALDADEDLLLGLPANN
tara:strand:+ start:523 stop:999 length:477 start_codon:yes stop_codon:yes gene_type:complete